MKPSRFSLRLFLWPLAVSVVISYFLLSLLGCASASAHKHDSLLPTDAAGMIEAVFSADAQMQAEQTFPIPMAQPALTRMKPSLDPKLSRLMNLILLSANCRKKQV